MIPITAIHGSTIRTICHAGKDVLAGTSLAPTDSPFGAGEGTGDGTGADAKLHCAAPAKDVDPAGQLKQSV